MDHQQEFLEWVYNTLGCAPDHLKDGKVTRFPTPDKPKGDKGYCRLFEHGDWAGGYCGIWGETDNNSYNWHSKSAATIPDDERRKSMKALKVSQQRLRDQEANSAAERCAELWDKAQPLEDHQYLEDKGIRLADVKPLFARQMGESIMLAMRNAAGQIRSAQWIGPDSSKRFKSGSSTRGLYSNWGGKPNGLLYICEGWATAYWVWRMTNQTAIVAFSADGLIEVAKIMREKYPGVDIRIAGDSGVVGQEKAHRAAATVDGYVTCVPDSTGLSDWCDVAIENGELDALALLESCLKRPDIVAKKPPAASPPVDGGPQPETEPESGDTGGPDDWRLALITDKNGKVLKNIRNYTAAFNQAPELSGLFVCDYEQSRVMVTRQLPGENGRRSLPRPIDDVDLMRAQLIAEDLLGFAYGAEQTKAVIFEAADRLAVEPHRDMLAGLQWDGVERINTWLIDLMGADDNELNRAFGRKFLIGAVGRWLSPGSKFDTMLVLEGEQGIGKSRSCRALSYGLFTDAHIDMGKPKEAGEVIEGAWIVEIAELTSLAAAKYVEQVKNFLSQTEDKYREAYGKFSKIRPRRCVFIGTTNEGEYLRDVTGNRRFWPVHVKNCDVEKITELRDQLWAEAVVAYQAGEQTHLIGELGEQLKEAAHGRTIEDTLETYVAGYIENCGYKWVTIAEIKHELANSLPPGTGSITNTRLAKILNRMRWQRTDACRLGRGVMPRKWGGGRPYPYFHPDLPSDIQWAELEKLQANTAYGNGDPEPEPSKVSPIRDDIPPNW